MKKVGMTNLCISECSLFFFLNSVFASQVYRNKITLFPSNTEQLFEISSFFMLYNCFQMSTNALPCLVTNCHGVQSFLSNLMTS